MNIMETLEDGECVSAPPLLSVVMPVHNASPYLDESIRSILAQTFENFEFVILDDASTDGSPSKLREWAKKDARIRLYRSDRNLGLSGSSNFVVQRARAALIARMDADDISLPERLMRQWEVMRGSPDVALVGTLCDGIDATGRHVRPRDRWRLARRSEFPPFPHGSVMFRRDAFDEVGGYNEDRVGGEDQDLFLKIARRRRVVVLPDLLYHYRYHVSCSSLDFFLARAAGNNGFRHNGEQDSHGPDMHAIRSIGALQLWAGHRPEALRLLLASGAHKSWSATTIYTLAWSAWGRLSPGSLRTCLRCFIRARDLLVSRRLRDGRAYEWLLE
jgi:glycosyltransferase involved in cell wall biosynthesis